MPRYIVNHPHYDGERFHYGTPDNPVVIEVPDGVKVPKDWGTPLDDAPAPKPKAPEQQPKLAMSEIGGRVPKSHDR